MQELASPGINLKTGFSYALLLPGEIHLLPAHPTPQTKSAPPEFWQSSLLYLLIEESQAKQQPL